MQNAKLKMKMKICNLQFAIDQRGFTLVELLIAMAIASVVGMAGVAVFSSSNWAYKLNEDVAEAQQNARVVMERLSKDIRAAGFGLPDPPFSLTFTGLPSTFVGQSGGNITLTSAITVTTSGGPGGSDSITILGIGYEAGKLQSAAGCTNGSGTNVICMNTASFFSDSGNYVPARGYISLNGTTFIELSSNAGSHVNAVQGSMTLSGTNTLDRNYPDGTPVFIVQAVQYTIVADTSLTGCSSTNPCLASLDSTGLRGMNGGVPSRQVLAENIEDIQFAYGVDADGDGMMDSTTLSNDPTDDSTIVAVRATVVAKARNKDMRGATFTRPAIEDHDPSAADNYRRRILTKILKARNPRTGF